MKDLYLALAEQLTTKISELKFVDFYKGQFTNLPKEHPMDCPAILIEYADVNWIPNKEGIQTAAMTIRIHVGQSIFADSYDGSSNQDKGLTRFDFLEKVNLYLQGFEGDKFTKLDRVRNTFDELPTNFIVDQIEYSTKYTDDSVAEKNPKYQKIPHILKLQKDIIPDNI